MYLSVLPEAASTCYVDRAACLWLVSQRAKEDIGLAFNQDTVTDITHRIWLPQFTIHLATIQIAIVLPKPNPNQG